MSTRRSEVGSAVLTYLPDHEPALGVRDFPLNRDWTSGIVLAAGSDLLIHDAQYTDDEYTDRIGWGHSSFKHAFEFATCAEAKHLVPFHHDPTHSDADLDRLIADAVQSAQPAFVVTGGIEGMTFDVGS